MATAPQALFLAHGAAARFALYHAPAAPCRGAWLYLHPWAEEMNKARRMAALQSRALAAKGWAVLQLDLHGCGDSAGDFGEAGWDSWRADVALGLDWLQATLGQQLPQAPGLWGLRLGALLALDYASRPAGPAPSQLLLWQPVLQGASHLTQFLRLRVAAQMLGEGSGEGGTDALRATLAGGSAVEVAGYTLAPAMAAALDTLDAGRLPPPCPVNWLEVAAAEGRPLSPVSQRVLQGWQAAGVDGRAQSVAGPQFWATQEIAEAPALLAATCAMLREACHA